jgi:hypothetical protein
MPSDSNTKLGLNLFSFPTCAAIAALAALPIQMTAKVVDDIASKGTAPKELDLRPLKTGSSELNPNSIVSSGALPKDNTNFVGALPSQAISSTRSKPESSWGSFANCYAYAMNCEAPENGKNGGAKPGAKNGLYVNPLGSHRTKEYSDALIKGAILDGATPVEGDLLSPPEPISGSYLVALICDGTGFHWLRRDENTRTWSWKDGNGDTVKHSIYKMKNASFVTIQDGGEDNLSTLIKTNSNEYVGWRYHKMQFISYFRVPDSGCAVAGQPKTKPFPN